MSVCEYKPIDSLINADLTIEIRDKIQLIIEA